MECGFAISAQHASPSTVTVVSPTQTGQGNYFTAFKKKKKLSNEVLSMGVTLYQRVKQLALF